MNILITKVQYVTLGSKLEEVTQKHVRRSESVLQGYRSVFCKRRTQFI